MENTIFKYFDYSLKTPIDSRGKKCFSFYHCFYFLTPTKEELTDIISMLQNTVDNFEEFNNYLIEENEKIYREMFTHKRSNQHTPKEIKPKPIRSGYVYIVKCNCTGYYKIGMTCSNIDSRIKQLKTSNASIELVNYFDVDDVEIEKKLHLKYKNKNVNREWFSLNEKDLESIYKTLRNGK